MKWGLTLLVLIGILGGAGYLGYEKIINPCGKPLQYSIGTFDTRFGVSQVVFKNKIEAASNIWEKAFGKDFFVYNPEAKFKINLIYDERQKEVDSKRKTEFGLSAAEASFKKLDADFTVLKTEYTSRSALHEAMVARFKTLEAEYEQQVNYWNSKGGAPKDEYEALERKRMLINSEVEKINQDVAELNTLSTNLNALLKQRNEAADSYNTIAKSYNAKYGEGLEFDQAEYVSKNTSKAINVYEFGSGDDLTIALAHELGHSLGMQHVEDSKSIMYYMTGKQTLSPTGEDLAELKKVCKL